MHARVSKIIGCRVILPCILAFVLAMWDGNTETKSDEPLNFIGHRFEYYKCFDNYTGEAPSSLASLQMLQLWDLVTGVCNSRIWHVGFNALFASCWHAQD